MGSECSENEREFRYRIFHEAIYAIENDIKKDLNSTNKDKKQYLPFGLINHDIIKKYKFLSNKNFDSNEARTKKFDLNFTLQQQTPTQIKSHITSTKNKIIKI